MVFATYDDVHHVGEAHRAYAITSSGLREYHSPDRVLVHSAFDLSHIRLRQPDARYQAALAAKRENLNPAAIQLLIANDIHGSLMNARTLYPLKRYLERQGYDAIKITDPKDAGRKVYIVFNTDQIRAGRHGGTQRYAVAHAPKGGITIGGKEFAGGEFIPGKYMAQATPEEKAAIESGQESQPPAAAPPMAPSAGPPSPDLPLVQFNDQPTIDFLANPTKLKPLPGKKRVSAGQVVESIKKMQPLSRVEFDHTSPNFRPKEYAKRIDIAVDEIACMLGMNVRGKAGTRSDEWYTRGIIAALDASKEFAPELFDKMHPGYRLAFFALCAITSANTAPSVNWKNALTRFTLMCDAKNGPPQFPLVSPYPDDWKNEGGKHAGVPSMDQGIELLNYMMRSEYEKHADIKDEKERRNRTFLELNRWLSTPHQRAEMYEIRRDARTADGDYVFRPTDTKRNPGSFAPTGSGLGGAKGTSIGFQIFGSKVPRFFLNIVGEHMHATVDKWATRSIARVFGQLDDEKRWGEEGAVSAPLDNEYASMENVLKDVQSRLRERTGLKLDTDQVQAAWWFFEKRLWFNHGYDAARESTSFFENGAVGIPRRWIEMRRAGLGRSAGKGGGRRANSAGAAGKAKYSRIDRLIMQRRMADAVQRYSVAHAPKGGIAIKGRKFSGGEFIPSEVMAQATPDERNAIEGVTPQQRKQQYTEDYLEAKATVARKIKAAADYYTFSNGASNPAVQQKAKDFTKLMAHVADQLSPGALKRAASGLSRIQLMRDIDSVTKMVDRLQRRRYDPQKQTAGFYNPNSMTLVVDGDADWGHHESIDLTTQAAKQLHEQGLAHNVYAHELWHAIDYNSELFRDGDYSNTDAWMDAWSKEIVKYNYEPDENGNLEPVRPLTAYAASSQSEGFAEFGRLVVNDPETARTKFPTCWRVLQNFGLV